jgi:hypothetical protein
MAIFEPKTKIQRCGWGSQVCRRHPAADRPLIDYDVILMMEPLTMLGALLGSMVR